MPKEGGHFNLVDKSLGSGAETIWVLMSITPLTDCITLGSMCFSFLTCNEANAGAVSGGCGED